MGCCIVCLGYVPCRIIAYIRTPITTQIALWKNSEVNIDFVVVHYYVGFKGSTRKNVVGQSINIVVPCLSGISTKCTLHGFAQLMVGIHS